MANNLNQCQFIGHLGQDAEIRFTKNGDPVANISLAVGESWKDKNGNKQESTEWVRGVAFGKLAEIIQQYTRKGSKLFISTKCKTRKWQDNNGQDRYTTEFIINQMEMLDSQQQGQAPRQTNQPNQPGYVPHNQQPAQQRPQYAGNGQQPQVPPQNPQPAFDDEIPFN